MRCAVFGCNSDNQSKKNPCNVKFFHFPKNEVACKKWFRATKRQDKFNLKTACICSKHFLDSDFKVNLKHKLLNYTPKHYRGLKDDAVPTQNLVGSKKPVSNERSARIRKRGEKQLVAELLSSGSRMSSKCVVSVCQFTATHDKESNFNIVKSLVEKSVVENAKMVFLPEACDYISRNKNEFKKLAERIDGPLMSSYKELAMANDIWLSVGGFHERFDEVTIYNSHVLINNHGEISGIYRKIHLFDVSIPDKNILLRESDNNASGSQIVGPILSPIGLLGLQICYDLRFPEQSTLLRKLNSDILTFPSAFTSGTGKVHWEVLLRARAIENQCYVIAAAQYGTHNEKRTSYGHSMIIDPWGQVLAECPKYVEGTNTNESIATATINLDLVRKVRVEMPVFSHRRNDIYSLNLIRTQEPIDDNKNYPFADKIVPGKTVFYASKYCYAFTNIRCVVPGHVLITPLRCAKRLQDLSEEETADLFQTAIKVSKVMETVHDAQSSTLCVQDGQFAGQTVPQVHAHILPRKKGDFANNDDIYLHLAQHDNAGNKDPFRTIEEQTKEALLLRKYLYQN